MVSQKCQYAIRAVFELAKRNGQGPIKINDIAAAQAIPLRFLEVILNQLRRGSFVQSRRGVNGGYLLARKSDQVTVGEIVWFMEGPQVPVACLTEEAVSRCSLNGNCVFMGMWKKAAEAVSDVYSRISFQDLVEDEASMKKNASLTYSI